MSGRQAPCDWPVTAPAWGGWDSVDSAVRDYATTLAVSVLWAFTGRLFGVCTARVRPARRTGPRYGVRVPLPGPVLEVVDVHVDGHPLAPEAYRLGGGNRLVRVDGGVWPLRQDLNRPPEAAGTLVVTLRRGVPVPPAGQAAAGMLAGELAKAVTGGACRLPARVQAVARQGVEVRLADLDELFEQRRTGIVEVDLWIAAVNPSRLVAPGRVYSPDLPVFDTTIEVP